MNHPMSPTAIKPYSDTELSIYWNSGESFRLPYEELRFHCPCAGCVDEMTGRRTLKKEGITKAIRPTRVTPVGRYAIQFTWNDGHSTGMYHYDRLNDLCKEFGTKLD